MINFVGVSIFKNHFQKSYFGGKCTKNGYLTCFYPQIKIGWWILMLNDTLHNIPPQSPKKSRKCKKVVKTPKMIFVEMAFCEKMPITP